MDGGVVVLGRAEVFHCLISGDIGSARISLEGKADHGLAGMGKAHVNYVIPSSSAEAFLFRNGVYHTASIDARVVTCSFLLPSFDI